MGGLTKSKIFGAIFSQLFYWTHITRLGQVSIGKLIFISTYPKVLFSKLAMSTRHSMYFQERWNTISLLLPLFFLFFSHWFKVLVEVSILIKAFVRDSKLCVESPMVLSGTQVGLLRKHGGHSFCQLFSLSVVKAKDGWSTFQSWSTCPVGVTSM